MSNVCIAIARNKKLYFPSEYGEVHFRMFLEKYEGRKIEIKLSRNPVSDEMRGWYYAAVLPTVKSLVPQWSHLSNEEVHEILKKNFNYVEAWNPITNRNERFGKSVMSDESNTLMAIDYIEKIRQWCLENYATDLPDPEKYKKWRDSAPTKAIPNDPLA